MMYDLLFFAPQITQILLFSYSLLVILLTSCHPEEHRDKGSDELLSIAKNTSTNAFLILHYTSFRSDELLRTCPKNDKYIHKK